MDRKVLVMCQRDGFIRKEEIFYDPLDRYGNIVSQPDLRGVEFFSPSDPVAIRDKRFYLKEVVTIKEYIYEEY